MIKSFEHKGLEKYFYTGSTRGIRVIHAEKLRRLLTTLNAATAVKDMDLPGYRLHPLKGHKKELWSVKVNGNWRITFKFKDGDAYIVNYLDYH